MVGFRRQGGDRRSHKEVAMANFRLNKTRVFLVAAMGYMNVGGRPQGCWGRSPTLGRVPIGPNLIHGPLDQNKVTQHLGQKTVRSKLKIAAASE
jgi:hypothetical protein